MNHQGTQLHELICGVKVELGKAQYSDLRIGQFVAVWNRLEDYMSRVGKTNFTAKIGMDFMEVEYGITVYRKLTNKNRPRVRAVNLLTDYMLHGIIFSKIKQRLPTYHPQFQILFQGYVDKKRADGVSEKTLTSYEIYLYRARFAGSYAALRQIDCRGISRTD